MSVRASFTQRFRIRFDECAHDGAARASAILRYVIETAFGHSAAAGYPLSWYVAHGRFWLVRRAQLALDESVAYGAEIDVTTRVVGARRFWARRENFVCDVAGRVIGSATTDWIFTIDARRPAQIPQAMERAFPVVRAHKQVDRAAIDDPPGSVPPSVYVVPAHQVDPAGHVNNAAYLDVFEDVLPGLGCNPQERPVLYELEYLQPVAAGTTVERVAWNTPLGPAILVRLPDGTPVVRGRRRSAARRENVPGARPQDS